MAKFAPSVVLVLILLCLMRSKLLISGASNAANCSRTELDALFDFRAGLVDPENRLDSWQGDNCCDWYGISCDNSTGAVTRIDLSNCGLSTSISSISPLAFPSLSSLDLSYNSFNSKFPDWVLNFKNLSSLDLTSCGLYGRVPLGLGELPSLRYLSLAMNYNLTASCTQLFRGSWRKIEFLDLGVNRLHGKLPAAIGNMASLTYLSLFVNNVQGGIPSTIGKLCNLTFFDVSGNNLTGNLPDFLEGVDSCGSKSPMPYLRNIRLSNNKLVGRLPEWLSQLESLEELGLEYNRLDGPIPGSLGKLQRLTHMGLAGNELNGSLPESFGQLSALTRFDVSFNRLTGNISEAHFSKLSKLKRLLLSSNSLTLNLSYNWNPPFQAILLDLGSCHVGPLFPDWIRTQKEIMFLDLSNGSISDSIPNWFWDMSFNLSLLNFSMNQLHGELPYEFDVDPFADIDLSSNLFKGPVPLPSVEIELFSLSSNQFSGAIPCNISKIMPNLIFLSLANNSLSGEIPPSLGEMNQLQVIDLSYNTLTGSVPESLSNCSYLKALDLGYNNLSREIPESLGSLNQLRSLHLNNNNFSGDLPWSLKNLSSLETLDLANNGFSGNIPRWVGDDLTSLKILSLRSNSFSGEIPTNFPGLGSLQVLDLGLNRLSGAIPGNLGDLKAMSRGRMVNQYRFYGFYRGIYYKERLVVDLEGGFLQYTKTLSLVAYMDLSNNALDGRFPNGITRLVGLVFLNLSRNQIDGPLPETVSKLANLASLDLSGNRLWGAIPSSLSSLTYLNRLNLSDNDFSGRIPSGGQMTTFRESSFVGNPRLCGPPLAVGCGTDGKDRNESVENEESEGYFDRWFPLSVGVGFAAGILVPFAVLSIRRPWSQAYFNFLEKVVNRLVARAGG